MTDFLSFCMTPMLNPQCDITGTAEIQEWSHKSRSRINNLYLLTRPIAVVQSPGTGYWWIASYVSGGDDRWGNQLVFG